MTAYGVTGHSVRLVFGLLLLGLCLTGWPVALYGADVTPPAPQAKPAVPDTASPLISRGPTQDEKHLKQAIEALRAEDYRGAEAAAAGIADPAAKKLYSWFEMTRDRPQGDFAVIARFLKENPNWPELEEIRRRAERVMPAELSDDAKLTWFAAQPPLTYAGTLAYAEALQRAGKALMAEELLRRNWVALDLDAAEESEYLARYGDRLRKTDHIDRLDRLLWDRRRHPATRQAQRLGASYGALTKARLRLMFRHAGVDQAIRSVPAALAADPGLIYERAYWRYRRGDYEGVIELVDPPNAAAPRPDKWWRLRSWVARRALEEGDTELAYRQATAHGFRDGLGFAEGEWLAGWIALRFQNKPKTAYEHFLRLYESVTFPISRARGAYWAGAAAEAMGETAWAERWYSIAARFEATFYGQLANHKLAQPLESDGIQIGPASDAERQAFAARDMVQAVKILGTLGERGLQTRFLDRLREAARGPADFTLVAELAIDVERPERALRAAKAAYAEGLWLADHLFPMPFVPAPGAPEPALVLAVIRQESAFDSHAISHAGARGLMQLMPATARKVARELHTSFSRRRLTGDPSYNIRLGRAYLAEQIEKYDGSYILAAAAYNAGPHRVDRWLERFGDPRDPTMDPIDWIEAIPFNETRNYVQRVLEGLAVYRRMLPGPQQSRWPPNPIASAS